MAIRRKHTFLLLALVGTLLAIVAAGCGGDEEAAAPPAPPAEPAPAEPAPAETAAPPAEPPAEALSGTVEADGSSTVGPLTTAAAEAFQADNPDVVVTVGISGTGGGFERFCAGETDISDASRPIKDEEATACADAGIDYVELPVAIDALTVVVNSANDWVDCMTVDQLHKIWAPEAEGKVTNWNQIDPSYPDQELVLAGPGTDSGTFDYFTGEVNGEEGASRADYTASEDDNVIVQAVAGDKGAMGYFGYTYYEENEGTLKALGIDGGGGCIAPSAEAAKDGSYTPLARPLFIYVKKESLQRPEVQAFVQYYLDNIDTIAETAQYIEPSDEQKSTAASLLASALG